MREVFDRVDRRLSRLLAENGGASVNDLAARLEVSPPTVRARLKALVGAGLLKIVGVLNVSERPELISAIIGIHANGRGKLDEIARRMSELPFVTSVSIVTGRYDLIAEVLIEGDMADLYRVTSELLPGLAEPGCIQGSETFVVMRSHNRWLSVPKGVWEDDAADPRARGRRRPRVGRSGRSGAAVPAGAERQGWDQGRGDRGRAGAAHPARAVGRRRRTGRPRARSRTAGRKGARRSRSSSRRWSHRS